MSRPFPEDDDVLALAEEDLLASEAEEVNEWGAYEADNAPDDCDCDCDPYDPGNEDGCPHEVVAAIAPSPYYGGEGHGSYPARQLMVVQELADRSAMAHKERIVVLESDVRDAMLKARARLAAAAQKYGVQGYTWDLDDIAYEHGGRRIITATLRISR